MPEDLAPPASDVAIPAGSAVTKEAFRDAMSLLAAPVVLVTTDGPFGRNGLTVSAITSVSDTPPTLLVCLNRSNRSHDAFLGNRKLGISILAHDHDSLAGTFASSKAPVADKFQHGAWHSGETGVPLLDDALVTLECTIDEVHESGTHDVLFCKVEKIGTAPETGLRHALSWFSRRFHHLPGG